VTRFDENADVRNYQKTKEGKPAASAADQRHLYARTSISDITAKVENDWRKTCSGSRMMTKAVHPLLTRI
jgi:hypothetical protein